jgi:hypothetical protein
MQLLNHKYGVKRLSVERIPGHWLKGSGGGAEQQVQEQELNSTEQAGSVAEETNELSLTPTSPSGVPPMREQCMSDASMESVVITDEYDEGEEGAEIDEAATNNTDSA